MRLKKKRNILLKLIVLTIILSIALPFSISLAAISDQIRLGDNVEQTNDGKTAVRDGFSCTEESSESYELNVRSNSIKGVNSANSGGPFYCMWNGRALTYFNKIVIDTSEEGGTGDSGGIIYSEAGVPGIKTGTGTSGSISDILSFGSDISSGMTEGSQTNVGAYGGRW